MKIISTFFMTAALLFTSAASFPRSVDPNAGKTIHHFVFFGMDREKIKDAKLFLETQQFEGGQLSYSWRQLEPAKDEYDFSSIRDDLAFLSSHGKKLWVQLQDVTFSERRVPVPKYLTTDPHYHGGAVPKYSDEKPHVITGWTTRRWDPAVQERLHKLLFALGKEFDARIEGINFAESAPDLPAPVELYPQGFSPQIYRDAIIANMKILKQAFPESVALQYANFMPGEWRPAGDKGYLRAVYQAARDGKIGVGGPDLFPFQPGQMGNSYPLINEIGAYVKVGIAVQDGNYAYINPRTGDRVTIAEQIEFAGSYLKADYIFWCTEEPYFSNDLVPFLRSKSRH